MLKISADPSIKDVQHKCIGDATAYDSERQLVADHFSWVTEFIINNGRRPKLLHVGNIANNAYNNAKLLNAAGLDCDVICYDYYHIMGCPEWEDADFEGEISDHFLPQWHTLNLRGFCRPRWFAQGPKNICIRYLLAKRAGHRLRSALWWHVLELERKTLSACGRGFLTSNWHKIGGFVKSKEKGEEWSLVGTVIGLGVAIQAGVACIAGIERFLGVMLVIFGLLITFRQHLLKGLLQVFAIKQGRQESSVRFDEKVTQLVKNFAQLFPLREDQLCPGDLEVNRIGITAWQSLFAHYDLVIGYSTDGIYPMLADKRPYLALEHGTLRSIPFQPDAQGRTTALSYALADHVLVTNADCMENAKFLAGERMSFMNHPYDEDHGTACDGWQELRSELCKTLDAAFLIFFPTRHDWVPGSGYADKANDVLLKAFVRLRKDNGIRVGMVCCRWGANVQDSMALIEQGGCAGSVRWMEPMGTVKFERYSLACHMVCDQFKLGAFGGVFFKAMSLGVPICTYLDEESMRHRYSESPPIVNCRTENELVERIREFADAPAGLEALGRQGRTWIKRHYSAAETVRVQMKVFSQLLKVI